jgi:phosphoglycolate phosphatase
MATSSGRPTALFDLDGTLVDSAPGIVESLSQAFAACGICSPVDDWRRFIGPPLAQMLDAAAPNLSARERDAVIRRYREHYAAVGLFKTGLFPGTAELLAAIARNGIRIYVVTNKPQRPAEAILSHLKLDAYIHRIVGGDPAGRISKPERTAMLARDDHFQGGTFVGDGVDDLFAAERIDATFFLAGWGYGSTSVRKERPEVALLARPLDLLDVRPELLAHP